MTMPADFNIQPDTSTIIPEELRNSLDRILCYAQLPEPQAETLKSSLDAFRNLEDKSFSNLTTRSIRDDIISVFFDIYPRVLKRVIEESNHDKLFHMFLNLGYLDERLLTPEQVTQLYEVTALPPDDCKYAVHDLAGWLCKIYQREKEPSINEYEQDYLDVFRERKRQGQLTDKDRFNYENDVEARLSHEIDNLFKLGQS